MTSVKRNGDAIAAPDTEDRAKAEINSLCLRRAVEGAIKRQADAWGIPAHQAQVLLLDHRMPA